MGILSGKNIDICFIHIPKSGGSFIERKLIIIKNIMNLHGSLFRGHIKIENLPINPTTVCFMIVRNPYERLFSAYNYLKKGGTNNSDKTVWNLLQNPSSFDEFINNIYEFKTNKYSQFSQQKCFQHLWTQFVFIENQSFLKNEKCPNCNFQIDKDIFKNEKGQHFCCLLCKKKPNCHGRRCKKISAITPKVNVLKYEHLDVDFTNFINNNFKSNQQLFSLFEREITSNIKIKRYENLTSSFTKNSIEKINILYKEDFINFDYNMIPSTCG